MTDSELIEHLHARGWNVGTIDVPMIREACKALQPSVKAVVWALKFPGDGGRLCLSTMFDTEEEAKEYASRCESAEVVPLAHLPVTAAREQEASATGAEEEAFEQLCREHDILGTAAARQCEVFWRAGARFAGKVDASRVREWKDVRIDGLPPCDGETVYVGENEAGFMGCFNAYSDEACWMDTPEYTYNVMSGLRFWRVQDRPTIGTPKSAEGEGA